MMVLGLLPTSSTVTPHLDKKIRKPTFLLFTATEKQNMKALTQALEALTNQLYPLITIKTLLNPLLFSQVILYWLGCKSPAPQEVSLYN
jgi:hypothetical protein